MVDEEDEEETYYEIDFDVLNNNRLGDYSRLDLGIRYRHEFKSPKLSLEAAFSIINLFNHQNLFTRDYHLTELDDDDEEPEIFYIEKQLLKRTPQLLFRIYW